VWLSRPSGRAWGGGWLRAVFASAAAFNGDLSAWNVSRVRDMSYSACSPAAAVPPPPTAYCGLWSWVRAPRGGTGHGSVRRLTRGGWGGRAVFYGATAFNGDVSAWNVGSVVDMSGSACGPASAVSRCPRVCTRAEGSHSPPHPRREFSLRPQPPSAASGGGGAWGRLASAGVRCPTVGLEPPTTRSCCSAATGVWLSRPSGRAWGGGWLRAVFASAAAFNGDLSAWNVGNVQSMTGSASGPASIPCPAALVCAAQPGEVTLRPPPSGAASAGGAGSPLRAYVNCALWSWVRAPRWPQLRAAAADARVRGGGGGRAVFAGAAVFNGNLSAWNISSVTSMHGSASGPASIPGPAALVCAAQPGAVTLRPPPSGAASAGGAGSPLRAYVNCALWS
jgi:surface protein